MTKRVLSRETENAIIDNGSKITIERIGREQYKLDQPSSHYHVRRKHLANHFWNRASGSKNDNRKIRETGSTPVLNCERASNPQKLKESLHSVRVLVTFSSFDTPESNFCKGK